MPQDWWELNQIDQLADIEPLHVAAYIVLSDAAHQRSPHLQLSAEWFPMLLGCSSSLRPMPTQSAPSSARRVSCRLLSSCAGDSWGHRQRDANGSGFLASESRGEFPRFCGQGSIACPAIVFPSTKYVHQTIDVHNMINVAVPKERWR